jgi:drug/metabolite transporter (DMT)-like permease
VPFTWTLPAPSLPQMAVLFVYGAVQMALPYWLMARALRSVSPQEAGTLTLLEPLLNPLWAYLVSPATEMPTAWTLYGGACILGALAYRYWPRRVRSLSGKETGCPSPLSLEAGERGERGTTRNDLPKKDY